MGVSSSVQLAVAVLVFVLAAEVLSLSKNDCQPKVNRDHYLQVHNNYCYEFVMYKSVEFDEAKTQCESKTGSMVKIPNSDVQNYLQGELRATYFQDEAVWIGLTDENSDNQWEWVLDGTKTDNYNNWAPGQPGIAHGLGFEDCAAMEPGENGKWHDYRCSDLLFVHFGHPYICQYGPIGNTSSVSMTSPSVPVTSVAMTSVPVTSLPSLPTQAFNQTDYDTTSQLPPMLSMEPNTTMSNITSNVTMS